MIWTMVYNWENEIKNLYFIKVPFVDEKIYNAEILLWE